MNREDDFLMISASKAVTQPSIPAQKTQHTILSQFFYFTGVGVVGTLIQYVVLLVSRNQTTAPPILASGVGFVLGAFVSYILNYRYTFRSVKNHREAITKFMAVVLIGLLLNTFVMLVGAEFFVLHYLLAQILATVIVLIWNFSVNILWTFR